MRHACVTDYHGLYATDYFAHQAGSSSFNVQAVPPIVAEMSEPFGRAVLDIGGGSGYLSALLAPLGVKGFTIDAAVREGEAFQTFDIAAHDLNALDAVRRRVADHLGPSWFATCFDVAEHIDREHIADFLLNLSVLIPHEGVISISTRPSSSGNRFHATIIPIDVWIALLNHAGFDAVREERLEPFANGHLFHGANEALIAVSHWQRINPFRDRLSHQHYLRLVRRAEAPRAEKVRAHARRLLDLDCRLAKRQAAQTLPPLTFNVHFIQDWSFARSLMGVWPAEQMRILLRRDCIAAPYRFMIENYCRRVGVAQRTIATVHEGEATLAMWNVGDNDLVVTATEGVVSPTHMMNSLLMEAAGRRGAATVCLQHGQAVSVGFRPASQTVGAWDVQSGKAIAALLGDGAMGRVACLGSTKFADALLPASGGGLPARLGAWTQAFERAVMVGLNLHWHVHENSAGDTLAWLLRLAENNAETLFIVRPHPDDSSIYAAAELLSAPNVVVLDDITLLSMDMSVARLMTDVGGLIATTSTLHLDARAAGKASVLLPSAPGLNGQAKGLLEVSWPSPGAPLALSEADWTAGAVPAELEQTPVRDEAWFAPSRAAISNLAACIERPRHPAGRPSARVSDDVATAATLVNFDSHPHSDRTRMETVIAQFCGDTA